MNYTDYHIWLFMIAALMVSMAMVFDYKVRRIPNFITFPSLLLGVVIHTIQGGWNGFSASLLGLLAGGGVFLLFYAVGGMGAGDVKLMSSVGALLGAERIVSVMLLTSCIGAVMAVYTLWRGAGFGAIPKQLKNWRTQTTESSANTIPYGVAIGVGTLINLTIYGS